METVKHFCDCNTGEYYVVDDNTPFRWKNKESSEWEYSTVKKSVELPKYFIKQIFKNDGWRGVFNIKNPVNKEMLIRIKCKDEFNLDVLVTHLEKILQDYEAILNFDIDIRK